MGGHWALDPKHSNLGNISILAWEDKTSSFISITTTVGGPRATYLKAVKFKNFIRPYLNMSVCAHSFRSENSQIQIFQHSSLSWLEWAATKLQIRLGKTNSRSEIGNPNRTIRTHTWPNTRNMLIRSDPNRTIPDPKFSTKLLVLAWQAYLIKNWLTRNWPEPKHIQPKPKRPEISFNLNMTQSELDLTCTRTEWPICKVYFRSKSDQVKASH